jgi:ADP-heptose:LPS heptosyltransferase
VTGERPVALALRSLGIGDLLTAVPALRGLRRALPGHRLVLSAPAALLPLVRLGALADELHDSRGLDGWSWSRPAPAVAVNLHGRGPRSHRALRTAGSARLVAFASAGAGHRGPAWEADEHEVARWCRLVDATWGPVCDPADLDLEVPAAAVPAGAVVVHPGAGSASRRWPLRRFAAVARALAAGGHRVVVTGSPAERELGLRLADAAGLDDAAVLAGRTDLLQLAAVVARARLVVGGDTGVTHLATAYRRPSVALFGPVSPALWGPPPGRPQHLVLWRGDGRGDPHGERLDPALASIGVEEVLRACQRQLDRGEASSSRRPSRTVATLGGW